MQQQARWWFRLRKNRSAIFGLTIALLLIGLAIFAPFIAPHPPGEQFLDGLSEDGKPFSPGGKFLLGTDLLGRDLLSRLLYGARASMVVGLVANGIAVFVGTLVGTAAGFFGGAVGTILMRFTDLMMAFPALLLAIALAAILKPSLWIVALVIALVNWVQLARVVYAQVLSLSQKEYVEAARALGSGNNRILFQHLIPQLVPTLLVWGSLGLSTTVLLEAALSFLGVGVQPPMPSWGGMINESQSYLQDAPWLVAIPGFSILLTSLAFNLLGDGLREAFDPTERA